MTLPETTTRMPATRSRIPLLRVPSGALAGAIALVLAAATHASAGGPEDASFNASTGVDPFGGPDPLSLVVHKGQDVFTPDARIGTLAVVLRLEESWHVNAHQPLEEWLIPTELTLTEPEGVEILDVVYPDAVELTFSFSETKVAVYEENAPIGVRFRIPGPLAGERVVVAGTVGYQACNDQTCLPPAEKPFTVTFPVTEAGTTVTRSSHPIFASIVFPDSPEAPGPATGSATRTSPPPEADAGTGSATETGEPQADTAARASERTGGGITGWLTRTIEGNFANPLVAGVLTLFAGLLSAATPCVYPMIPITARILMGRGGDNAALGRMHAGMYFVGIILVYALLGLIASATGGGFNELMRIPAVILAFAVLFALLGLSMFGLFEIQVPSGVATKIDGATSNRAGLLGTMLMGLGAGLVVSPCVGPVVFAILAQIANQIAVADAAGGGAVTKSGQLAYGGLLMGAYGAGLGIPFLLVGLFSARVMVARPGGWMTLVRVALGVIILYFAFDYFHKALETAGVARPLANSILAGVVLTFLSVIWGVFRPKIEAGPHAGWHKVRHAVTILMLVIGVFYLWTGLARSGLVPGGTTGADTGTPAMTTRGPAMEDSHGLVWHRDFAAAERAAREASLPVFVDFYAHWCANCKVFSANAAKEGPLRQALEKVVRAKVYDTDPIFATFKNDPRYGELNRGLPFFLLLSSDGKFLWKGTDYRAEQTFIREIHDALAAEHMQAATTGDRALQADRPAAR